ncbi:Hypothetical predicted protein [Octopus vulgaris]|uniref:Uncharacterized protein n=1 Tax=Octopus vulgaris TaxID=6645 RepID=A0AA36B8S3_OCTVU|nr:Hypothetical predicted protein [Octopus vulgaris]
MHYAARDKCERQYKSFSTRSTHLQERAAKRRALDKIVVDNRKKTKTKQNKTNSFELLYSKNTEAYTIFRLK